MKWVKVVFAIIIIITTTSCAQFQSMVRPDIIGKGKGQTYSNRGTFFDSYYNEDFENINREVASEKDQGNNWRNGNDYLSTGKGNLGRVYENTNKGVTSYTYEKTFKNGDRAKREDFVDDSPNEGSLWASTGQTNYFFTKNKVKTTGDLVMIKLSDKVISEVGNEIKAIMTIEEKKQEVVVAENNIQSANRTVANIIPQKQEPKNEEDESKSEEDNENRDWNQLVEKIEINDNFNLKKEQELYAEILQRFPNGNYKIRATKKFYYRGSPRVLSFVGIAQSNDVNNEVSLKMDNLYEYRVKVYR